MSTNMTKNLALAAQLDTLIGEQLPGVMYCLTLYTGSVDIMCSNHPGDAARIAQLLEAPRYDELSTKITDWFLTYRNGTPIHITGRVAK